MARMDMVASPLVVNGPSLDSPSNLWAGGLRVHTSAPERTILRVTNSAAVAHSVTIPSGSTLFGTYSNVVVAIPAGSYRYIGPFESPVVTQADGTIWINFEAGHTGQVTALQTPKGL